MSLVESSVVVDGEWNSIKNYSPSECLWRWSKSLVTAAKCTQCNEDEADADADGMYTELNRMSGKDIQRE